VEVCYPPPKNVLVDKIDVAVSIAVDPKTKVGKPIMRTLEHLKNRDADVAWLIKFLFIMDPNDEIFVRGYRYVKPGRASIEA